MIFFVARKKRYVRILDQPPKCLVGEQMSLVNRSCCGIHPFDDPNIPVRKILLRSSTNKKTHDNTWHSYFVGSKDISEATYITREISKHHFWCLVLYLSKIIWSPITSSGRFDVCLFRHILSLIPNSDHLFCRRYFLPIGRATVFSHMTDMLPKSHNIHPHTHTHTSTISPRHRYTQVKTRLRWKCSTSTVFLGGFEVKVWNFWTCHPSEKSLHNGREMVIWSAILSYRIPKHQTYNIGLVSIIFLVRFCLFVGSCHPVCEKSERKKHMKKTNSLPFTSAPQSCFPKNH